MSAAFPATVANMRQHSGVPGLIAYSPVTGEECSANPGDYWHLPEDEPLIDSNGAAMVLARITRQVVIL